MTDLRSAVVRLLNEVHDLRLEGNNPSLRAALADVRDALAHPAPPAEGEVGELVRWLRSRAGIPASPDFPAVAAMLTRAADLLEQRRPAPVPVSERLPDASDPGECRMPDGDCWWFDPHADGAWYFDTYQSNYTHWLPAHALPLPAGEMKPWAGSQSTPRRTRGPVLVQHPSWIPS